MSQKVVELDISTKVKRFLLQLDSKGDQLRVYEAHLNTIIIANSWDYRISQEHDNNNPLVLFEENNENSGNKPITGFQIKNVREICSKHDLHPKNGKLKVSDVLKAIAADNCIGFFRETAVDLALAMLERYSIDEIEFWPN